MKFDRCDFDALYGSDGKLVPRIDKAVCREIPGGNELLGLIEFVKKMETIVYVHEIEDIVKVMRDSIKNKYELWGYVENETKN